MTAEEQEVRISDLMRFFSLKPSRIFYVEKVEPSVVVTINLFCKTILQIECSLVGSIKGEHI